MDATLINPFLEAILNVLKTMAFVDAKTGKMYLKKDRKANGDVTGIIGLTGDVTGTLSITFTEGCIKGIIANMLGEEVHEIDDEVRDAVGEITNMACGDARRKLDDMGYRVASPRPTIVSGKNHVVQHLDRSSPCIAIPFETEFGGFTVEVSIRSEK
ncbi:MAG: chemotaxis protein CheX [Deltaproteobacteria bacterium]|nr:chemotaxis protein CheX [Deltaproteobacteria bacterium]